MLPQSVLVSVQIFKLHYVLVLSRLRTERQLLPDMGVSTFYLFRKLFLSTFLDCGWLWGMATAEKIY